MSERERNLSSEDANNSTNSSGRKEISKTGTSSQTLAFLFEIIRIEAYLKLDVRRRNLIGLYFGTEATLEQLTSIAQVRSKERVRQLITSGMKSLWQSLSPNLQEKYSLETVIQLKRSLPSKSRAKISKVHLAKWQDPEYRERMKKVRQTNWLKPEFRAKMKEVSKKLWQNPEHRARMSKILKKRPPPMKGKTHSPETRAKISAICKAKWQEPGHREKMRLARQGKTRSPEVRAKMSLAQKAIWQKPGHRERMSKIFKGRVSPMKGKTHSPETKAKISEKVKRALRKKRNRPKETIITN